MTVCLSLADTTPEEQERAAYARRVHAALRVYLDRLNKREQPLGAWSSLDGHCWYPDPVHERRSCCALLRVTPLSEQILLQHCRGPEHIARLHDIDLADLRAAYRRYKKALSTP